MTGNVVGNYKILEKIGEGGMGAVFKALDLMTERQAALKVLRPEFARQSQIIERFRSEAKTLARLNHPNIATLYGFFRQGDDFFMAMEFVRGKTLSSLIETSGTFQWQTALELFCQILEGIGYAHGEGIVHRDIKPSNVMLTDGGSVKVMDFGIARALGAPRITKDGGLVGTLAYMSPEQILGHEIDLRSDIYSLGLLLYEMLAGRPPFICTSEYEIMNSHVEKEPPSPRDFVPDIPKFLANKIMRALNKNVEARFQTTEEFRTDLLNSVQLMTAVRSVLDLARKRARWSGAKGPPITSNEWISVPPADSLEKIAQDIRTHIPDIPIIVGAGDQRAKLMVIGQSPGLNEIQEGKPFRGPTGGLVAKVLAALGLSREDCYLTYAIKCRETPRGNYNDESYYLDPEDVPPEIAEKYPHEHQLSLALRGETPDERDAPLGEAYRPYLLRELLAVDARVILSFGGLATRTLLRTDKWIPELRGVRHSLELNGREFVIISTFQPGILFHLPEKKNDLWEDLELVRDCLSRPSPGS